MAQDPLPPQVVVLDGEPASWPVTLPVGNGGHVWIDERGDLETDTRVELSSNSVVALRGHGVADALNRLPLEMGELGVGRDVLVPQHALDDAARIFVEADRFTYGATWELPALREGGPPPIEYRLVIDNREFQRTLARLQFLVSTASRAGHAVRLRF